MFKQPPASRRLISIDALRGGAALAVVLCHSLGGALFANVKGLPSLIGTPLSFLFSYGFTGIFLFFVISGFCIHMRWARSLAGGAKPDVNFVAFWKRRIRRLYPTYLIALFLYLALMTINGEIVLSRYFLFDLGLHLAMLHNLTVKTSFDIGPVFWTLAIEEQLYLSYFLLLAIRRRFGWTATLVICQGAGVFWCLLCFLVYPLFSHIIRSPGYIFFYSPAPFNVGALFYWFVWALGALAVEAAQGLVKLPRWCKSSSVGFIVLLVGAALTFLRFRVTPLGFLFYGSLLLEPTVWGVGFFCVFNRIVSLEPKWQRQFAPRVVIILAKVGIFSYSLYLVHDIFFIYGPSIAVRWFGIPDYYLNIFLLAVVPVSIAFAWIFFQLFEKPFLPKFTLGLDVLVRKQPGRSRLTAKCG